MCGIIGYIGDRKASEILTESLKRLEYRGYDSVGIAVDDGKKVRIRKDKGMIDIVATNLDFVSLNGNMGIGHSRWATHGAPCRENAHPHSDPSGKVVLVHNGVLENFHELKDELKNEKFASETDSEIIAHLIANNLRKMKPLDAFLAALKRLKGSYAIACMIHGEDTIFFGRENSPLIIGMGHGEMFCASDIPAMLKHTKTFVRLEDGDAGFITKSDYKVYTLDKKELSRNQITVDWDIKMAEKGGYPHFMRKEIEDQKHFINEALASDVSKAKALLSRYDNIHIIACGTSYHAGLMLSYLLQKQGKNAQAFIASDYPFIACPSKNVLIIAISQSGETADVLQALKYAKPRQSRIIAITNVVGSSITNIANEVVYLNAGVEIGVAATKTFTAQLAIVYKLIFGKGGLVNIEKIFEDSLSKENELKKIAARLADKSDVFFIARGLSVPIAYEGSLKFKEISYIHSEAYPAGELKHGTLSLIEDGVPVIILAPDDETLTKMHGSIKEAKSRGGMIISFTNDGNIIKESDYSVKIPELENRLLYPFALIIPLQLLAYHVSVLKGNDPDKPRNLAKSVTVE